MQSQETSHSRYDSSEKQNSVVQNAPILDPKSTSGGKGSGSGSGTGSGGNDFIGMFNNTYSRNDMYNFYGAKIQIISEKGTNNWLLLGMIHTSQAFYDDYANNGG